MWWTELDAQKRWVLFTGLSSFFLSVALLYQMSPFFQKFAMDSAGATPTQVGMIFAILPASAFVFSIPAAKLISRVGPSRALAIGLFVLALSSLMFGLSRSVGGWLLWRALQGAATAPIYSSVACMFATTFSGPGEFVRVNGLQEAVANIGFAVGPMLGGYLFEYGGFFAPFATSAVGHLLFVFLTVCYPSRSSTAVADSGQQALLAEEEGAQQEDNIEHAKIREVCSLHILLLVPAGILVPGFFGALDPVAPFHLVSCLGNIHSGTIGTLMALPSFPSIILAVLVPVIMRHLDADSVVLIGMSWMTASMVGLALSDPDSLDSVGIMLPVEWGSWEQWVLQSSLFLLIGGSTALGWTPVLPDLMEKAAEKSAAEKGTSREVAMEVVSPAVSSLFNGAAAIGEALGPVISGHVFPKYGFAGTFVRLAVVFTVYCVLILVYKLQGKREELAPTVTLPSAPKLRTAVPLPSQLSPRSELGRAASPRIGSRL